MRLKDYTNAAFRAIKRWIKQGYIIKIAMVRVARRMKAEELSSKMILQVHDELNFSVLPSEKEQLQRLVVEEMEAAAQLSVPLRADCGWGKNWLEAH